MATIYIQDTFTEGADTELSLHTPDIGGSWSKHPSFATNATVVAAEDRVRGDSSTASSFYINSTVPSSDNYEISWTARQTVVGTGSRAGAGARYDATLADGYFVFYDGTEWIFQRNASGVSTSLDNWNGSEVADTDYTIRWVLNGSLHLVYFDGVLRMEVRDTTFLSAGRVGPLIRLNGRVDNFTVQSLDPQPLRVEQMTLRVVSSNDDVPPVANARPVVFVVT